MHPLRTFLKEVGRRLTDDAMTARVQGNWEDPSSRPVVRIGPPAGAAKIAALEARLGRGLPPDLREVLSEVSAEIEIAWVLRGHYVPASWGGQTVEVTVEVPEAFLEWDRAPMPDGSYSPDARRNPRYLGGGLRFSMDGIEAAVAGLSGWTSLYDPARADDPDMAEHLEVITDFMTAGFPVMTAPNGDWLAIDQRDGSGCVMHVSHEGEEAGIEISLSLPNFLAHLAALGPVWPDYSEIFAFSDSVEEVVPGDYRITAASFRADGAAGALWRAWFWGGSPPAIPPGLIAPCRGWAD
jgi:hypothetical protein